MPEGPDQVTAWTDEQARRVVETYDAYFGTYQVDDFRKVVTHHAEGELRPNLVCASYGRRFALGHGTLVLSSVPPEDRWRVIWERAR